MLESFQIALTVHQDGTYSLKAIFEKSNSSFQMEKIQEKESSGSSTFVIKFIKPCLTWLAWIYVWKYLSYWEYNGITLSLDYKGKIKNANVLRNSVLCTVC